MIYLISIICILLFYKIYCFTLPPKQLRHLPRLSFWSYLISILKNEGFEVRYKAYKHILEKEGILLVWIFGKWKLYLGCEEDIQSVVNNVIEFPKQLLSEREGKHSLVCKFYGNNIVHSNNMDWKRHRRAINSFFHKKWDINQIFDLCNKLCLRYKEENLIGDRPFNPHPWHDKLILEILGKLVFNIDFKELELESSEAAKLYHLSLNVMMDPLYLIFPSLDTFRQHKLHVVKKYEKLIENFVSEREYKLQNKLIEPNNDALTALVYASFDSTPEEYRLSVQEVMSTFKMIFLAGHDTTSLALSGLLYHLAMNPHIQDKLRKEISENLTNKNQANENEIKSLKYMEMVIKENLRLLPSIAILPERINKQDCRIQNYFIPKNTTIQAHFYHVQRSAKYWKNPEIFDPERFLNATMSTLKSWLPFSNGPRSCMGTSLSLLEQKIALIVILNHFYIVWPHNLDKHEFKTDFYELLRPSQLLLCLKPINVSSN